MSALAALPRSALSDGVRVALVTPRATKDFERLSPPNRDRVVRALSSPVPGARYRKLAAFDRFAVYHFDVTRSVRVTCRQVHGQVCVVHIGTHPEFDEFLAHYTGTLPDTLIPLEKSSIMNPSSRTSTPANRTTSPSAPLPTPGADIIARAITALFQEAFAAEKDQFQTDLLEIADSVTSAREEAATASRIQGQKLETLTTELAAIETAAAARERALYARLEKSEEERDTRNASALQAVERGLTARLCAHEAGVAAVTAKVVAVRDELGRAITALQRSHSDLDRASEERLATLGRTTAEEQAALARRLNELADENVALREEMRAAEQHLVDYTVTAAGLTDSLEEIRRQVAAAVEEARAASERTERIHNSLLAHLHAEEADIRCKEARSLGAWCRRVVRTLRGALGGLKRLGRCR